MNRIARTTITTTVTTAVTCRHVGSDRLRRPPAPTTTDRPTGCHLSQQEASNRPETGVRLRLACDKDAYTVLDHPSRACRLSNEAVANWARPAPTCRRPAPTATDPGKNISMLEGKRRAGAFARCWRAGCTCPAYCGCPRRAAGRDTPRSGPRPR